MLISYEMQGSEEPSTTCVLLLAGELIYFICISDKNLITATTMGKIFFKKTFCVWVYMCEVKERVDVMLSILSNFHYLLMKIPTCCNKKKKS